MPQEPSSGFFFDVEKWFGSISTQRMSFAEKGVYLVMLFQEWRDKEKSLPDDPHAVADLIAPTELQMAEVVAAWPVVRRKFVALDRSPGRIMNVTVEKTRRKQAHYHRGRVESGRRGGIARARKSITPREIAPKVSLSSPQANPSDLTREEETRSDQTRQAASPVAVTSRSKRPIFSGQRFVVFEWQLDDLTRLLGAQTRDFDLHDWFFALDAEVLRTGEIVPQRDNGAWLQSRTLAEAQRRGLPVAAAPVVGKLSARMMAMDAKVAREVQ